MEPNLPFEQHLAQARDRFVLRFGRAARYGAAAPGRVNVVGEHTDYNDGFVCPIAIERQTLALAAPREDRVVTIVSTDQADPATIDLDDPITPGEPAWANYVKGVYSGWLCEHGDVPGVDLMIDSTVPVGSGLSSSAAIEVAVATLLEAITNQTMAPAAKALMCQHAEHTFAGVPCGIMDQFISVMGQPGRAMLLDCRSQQPDHVPLDDPAITLLVANTNVKHELTGGEYAQRRSQCEEAAAVLGATVLRDVDLPMLEAAAGDLDLVAMRRARHVVTENQRTLDAADAMRSRDWSRLGALMFESHASLRDDFEVSCTELDAMVAIADTLGRDAVLGSRMTGGGFGGCTISLVKTNAVEQVANDITSHYRQQTGIEPTLFATRPAQGARVIAL